MPLLQLSRELLAAVVNTGIVTVLLQIAVDHICPFFSPKYKLFFAVPKLGDSVLTAELGAFRMLADTFISVRISFGGRHIHFLSAYIVWKSLSSHIQNTYHASNKHIFIFDFSEGRAERGSSFWSMQKPTWFHSLCVILKVRIITSNTLKITYIHSITIFYCPWGHIPLFTNNYKTVKGESLLNDQKRLPLSHSPFTKVNLF